MPGSAREAHQQCPCRGRIAHIEELEAERDEVLLGLIELRHKVAKSSRTKLTAPVA